MTEQWTVPSLHDRPLLKNATDRLDSAGVPSPAHDARRLIEYAESAAVDLDSLIELRSQRVPLQHLLGTAAFRYLEFAVGPGVFLPRPETELLVDQVLAAIARTAAPLVVDLCAGSGAIGLSVVHEHRTAVVHLVERSEAAGEWLRRNVGLVDDRRAVVHIADLDDAPTGIDGTVDVVVSNPPYLPFDQRHLVDIEVRDHDPVEALWADDSGLSVIRRVSARATRLLRPGGRFVMEHSERHVTSVPSLLREAGFADVTDHDDLTGRPRFVTATWTREPSPC